MFWLENNHLADALIGCHVSLGDQRSRESCITPEGCCHMYSGMSDIVGDKISDMLCHCVTVPTMFAVRHLLLRLDTWQPPERRFYQSSDRVQPTGEGPPTSHRTKALVERDIRDRRYRIKHESSSDILVLGSAKNTIEWG